MIGLGVRKEGCFVYTDRFDCLFTEGSNRQVSEGLRFQWTSRQELLKAMAASLNLQFVNLKSKRTEFFSYFSSASLITVSQLKFGIKVGFKIS